MHSFTYHLHYKQVLQISLRVDTLKINIEPKMIISCHNCTVESPKHINLVHSVGFW